MIDGPESMKPRPRSRSARTVGVVLTMTLALAIFSFNLSGSVRAEDGVPFAATPVASASNAISSDSGYATADPETKVDPPSLSYDISNRPNCAPSPEGEATAAPGQPLVYDCALDIHIDAALIDPSDVTVTATIDVKAGSGWLAQVSMAASEGFSGAESRSSATSTTVLGGIVVGAADGGWTFTLTQQFKVVVRSISCGASANAATISADAAVMAPSQPETIVARNGGTPAAVTIAATAPAPQPPTVSFNGGLDFGSVPVTTNGPEVSTRTGSVSLTVSGLDATCGSWRIVLRVAADDDSDSNVLAPANFRLISVNGAPIADGACTLDHDCVVDVVSSGPDASPTRVYTLAVTMTLPDEPVIGLFNATLTTKAAAAD